MDDLFVIDTQGAASVPVSTATEAYECRVVGSAATPSHAVDSSRIKALGIRVIEDNIDSGPSDRAVPQTPMNNLNAKFVGLDVSSSSSPVSGKGGQRRGKNRRGIGAQVETAISGPPAAKWQRKQRPPIIEFDEEIDELFDDFISNIAQGDLKHLLKHVDNRSGYLSRNIGGGVEYNCGTSGDELASPEATPGDDAIEVDDPFKYEDEIHNLLDGGMASSGDDDDDGFPDDLDMERLAGPDADVCQTSRQPPPHVRRSQNAASFKEKDRAKSKHGHDKAKGNADDGQSGPTPGFDPRTIIKRLDMLALTDDMGSIWLQPMNKYERQIVHILAREYNVKSKSHGSGIKRTPVLTQTPSSRKPTNSRRINRVLMLHDQGGLIPEQWSGPAPQSASWAAGSKGKNGKGKGKGRQQGKGNNKGRGGGGGFGLQTRMDGKMVAENAPEVGSSNIGHKMLQQMGWQPGQGLGVKEEGRATPVDVMIRTERRGLGA